MIKKIEDHINSGSYGVIGSKALDILRTYAILIHVLTIKLRIIMKKIASTTAYARHEGEETTYGPAWLFFSKKRFIKRNTD